MSKIINLSNIVINALHIVAIHKHENEYEIFLNYKYFCCINTILRISKSENENDYDIITDFINESEESNDIISNIIDNFK